MGRGESAAIASWLGAALAYQSAGRPEEAERVCRQILAAHPGHAQTLHLLGLVAHHLGRIDDAIEHINSAIARQDRDPAFHHNLGNLLAASGRTDEAIAAWERALALAPDAVDTLYNLGNARHGQGKAERAIGYFERALRLRPDAIELHNNLASALQDVGRLDDAVAAYRKALALRPQAVAILDNLASALQAQGRLEEAQACCEQALARVPDHVESLVALGAILRELGLVEDAVRRCEQALVLAPDHPAALNNLGVALVELGRAQDAIPHYQRALAVDPERAETHSNLGIALERLGRHGEALLRYGQAIALKSDYAEAHFNRSHALLATGEWDEGWREYEWRFAVAHYDRKFDRPLWSGEPLADRAILIHAEQGFGDALQFIRYLPAVAERGGRVIAEVPEPLVRLARTVSGVCEVVAAGDRLPEFDCHCPLLSLPRVFKTTLRTIPDVVPYLGAPAQTVAAWRIRLGTASGLKAGVVWCGSMVGVIDRRPIDLRLLEPVFRVPGVTWFSLQVGERSRDLALLDHKMITDLSPWLTDFAETAAAMDQLDLVVTIDTAVAHLGGALGRPTWILLPYNSDWRWLVARSDSPWYPTARLFRQQRPGDWSGIVPEVAAALSQLTS
jgi:tetratricopeptide (TPR) repeat protein